MKLSILCALAGLALFAAAEEESYNPGSQKFLLGVIRTNVISTATTTTIAVAATTCYNAIGSTTCSGKKKKRALPKIESTPGNNSADLHASLNDAPEAEANPAEPQEEGVERLVIWRTSTTTLTYTSSSTVSGTKLSLSYACTASGMNLPPSC